MDEIISNLEQKIEKHFTQEELAFLKGYSKQNPIDNDNDFFLPTSKFMMLIFGTKAHNLENDINTPIFDGMYPLHLALLTPSNGLLSYLIQHHGANPNVRCCNSSSPFSGMTPLEMALHLVTTLIPWTPTQSLSDLIFMFYDKKVNLLIQHIRTLVRKSVGVRDLIFKLTYDVRVVELATLLMVASHDDNTISTMYMSTSCIPPEHHFGVPMMLRQLVASRISSLIKEEIHFKLSATHPSDEAYEKHTKKLMELTTVMKVLESADRLDLLQAYYWERCPAVDKDDNKDHTKVITKESQDESWVNRCLKTSLFYTGRSIFQPRGIFNSLMPLGYVDSFQKYDGLDIRDCNSLTETIFRELNGRKVEELSFEDNCLFRSKLKHCLLEKAREESILTDLQMRQSRKHTEHNRGFILELRPRSLHSPMNNQAFRTSRTLSTAACLTTGLPVYLSCKRNSVLGRSMSGLVIGDYDDEHHKMTGCCPDRKQKKCIEDWSSFPSKEINLIRGIIEKDKAAEFKSFLEKLEINNVRGDVLLTLAGCKLCPCDILVKICHHRASNCANELFSHEVGSMMNLNIQNCYGSYPLHDAAITLSSSMVKLLLDRGATPEAQTWDPVPSQTISALDYAVERLNCDKNLINWSPKKSVFKLIITLCLPQMKEARETIALLAGFATTPNILKDAIFNAVKRGQVVPVAALLLVARQKVLGDLLFFGSNVSSGPLTFPRAIMNELAALINQEYALIGREEHRKILQLCLEKKELMIYFLQMLEIFEKAGPALDSYLKLYAGKTEPVLNYKEVCCDVAKLLEDAGFSLSTKDTDITYIISHDSSLKPDSVPSDIEMKEQIYEEDSNDIWFRPVRKQLCRCDVKNASCTTSKLFHRLVGQSFSQRRGFSSHAGPSAFVKEESSKWISKRVVKSASVVLAALKRRGARAVLL